VNIDIIWSPSQRQVHALVWQADTGATVDQAMAFLSAQSADFAAQQAQQWHTAVWGKPVEALHVLQDGDRLEILRPLRVDPKVARRERFQRQGAKAAGLFAKRRAGAKAGY
jgi:putative ubiquitin-RnfH superfamily antitoxin RatB of RatAB toxin-antitoxin module